MTSDGNVQADLASALRQFFSVGGVLRLDDALALWPPEPYAQTAVSPNSLPVLDHLGAALDNAPAAFDDLVSALAAAQDQLHWQQTYSENDLGATFLQRYGWTLIVSATGPIISQDFILAFLLLGPDIEYPPHRHATEEYYRVVSGRSSWKIGDADWSARVPGDIVHNPPWQLHGMRTHAEEPLLLAALWRSGTVEKSVVVTD